MPANGNAVSKSDIIMIPFGILWCGFAVFWELSAIESGIPFMMIWGIPFVAAGLYLLIGSVIHQAYRRNKTLYAITDRRVIVICGNDIAP